MIEKLKHKYALSSKGAKDMVRAFIAVTCFNVTSRVTLFISILFIR